ncbi:MAG: TraB/GumN family protein [Deltaproteobacteria bacterium]|nr:TraB/GumN family protein [Deltaproteobacteria bacterium]
MLRNALLALTLAALLAPAGALHAEGPAPAGKAAAKPAKAGAASGPHFLWTVKGKEGGELTLLGSVHLGDPSLYPLPAAMEKRFEAAEVVAVEADVDGVDPATTQSLLLSEGMLTDGSSLSDHLPPETYSAVTQSAAKAGMTMLALDRMKPWLAAVTLMGVVLQKAGITGKYGVERYFLKKARGEKPIVELEGVLAQLKLFASFDEKEQAAFLSYTLEDLSLLTEETQKLLAAWKAGDLAYMVKLLDEIREGEDTRAIYDVLFLHRNERMTEKLDGYLKSGKRHFVIVGAAHLVGDDGLPSMMKKRGHTVTRH